MRSHAHRSILKKITELNLDPKVPYVLDANKNLVPKHKKEEPIKDTIEYILGSRSEDAVVEEKLPEVTEVFEPVKEEIPSGVTATEDHVEELSKTAEETPKEEVTEDHVEEPVKKKLPFGKKKVSPPTEQSS